MATYLVTVGYNINSCASPDPLPTISCTLLPMASKTDKLPLETEPAALDNNTIFMLNMVTKLSLRLTQLLKVRRIVVDRCLVHVSWTLRWKDSIWTLLPKLIY